MMAVGMTEGKESPMTEQVDSLIRVVASRAAEALSHTRNVIVDLLGEEFPSRSGAVIEDRSGWFGRTLDQLHLLDVMLEEIQLGMGKLEEQVRSRLPEPMPQQQSHSQAGYRK